MLLHQLYNSTLIPKGNGSTQFATLEMAVMDLNSGDELQTQFTLIACTKLF